MAVVAFPPTGFKVGGPSARAPQPPLKASTTTVDSILLMTDPPQDYRFARQRRTETGAKMRIVAWGIRAHKRLIERCRCRGTNRRSGRCRWRCRAGCRPG